MFGPSFLLLTVHSCPSKFHINRSMTDDVPIQMSSRSTEPIPAPDKTVILIRLSGCVPTNT